MNTINWRIPMERINRLRSKYFDVLKERYPDSIYANSGKFKKEVNRMSELELCFRIIADDEALTTYFAQLYRGWILGDNDHDPIDLIINRIYETENV